jgi:hypothetical protein
LNVEKDVNVRVCRFDRAVVGVSRKITGNRKRIYAGMDKKSMLWILGRAVAKQSSFAAVSVCICRGLVLLHLHFSED